MHHKQTVKMRAFAEAMRDAGHVFIHGWATVNQPLYRWRTFSSQVDAPRPPKASRKYVPLPRHCVQALQAHGPMSARGLQEHINAPLADITRALSRADTDGRIHRVGWEPHVNRLGATHMSSVYAYGPGVSVPLPGVQNSVFDVR